jgi:hypothetical protein
MNDFVKFEDMTHLKSIIIPKINKFKKQIEEFSKQNSEHVEIIKRFDEILLEKASKFQFQSLEHKFEQLQKEDANLMEELKGIDKR